MGFLCRSYARAAAAVLLLALPACSVLSGNQTLPQFTRGDLANAAALATSSGDTAGAGCWTALGSVAQPTQNPTSDGVAVLAERIRLAQGVALNTSCAQIILQTELMLLGLVPKPVPFLPPPF